MHKSIAVNFFIFLLLDEDFFRDYRRLPESAPFKVIQ
jgi:hypothetical protein